MSVPCRKNPEARHRTIGRMSGRGGGAIAAKCRIIRKSGRKFAAKCRAIRKSGKVFAAKCRVIRKSGKVLNNKNKRNAGRAGPKNRENGQLTALHFRRMSRMFLAYSQKSAKISEISTFFKERLNFAALCNII